MAKEKIALIGLSRVRTWKVTQNDTDGFTLGEMMLLPNAQTLSKTQNSQDMTIRADDGIYYRGSTYDTTDLELVVADLSQEERAFLEGGTYDETTETYTKNANDVAPELAFGFAALRIDGGYRLYQYYAGRVTKINVSHATKGQNNDVAAYTISLSMTQRNADGAIYREHDIKKADLDFTWLDEVDTLPVVPDLP